MARHWCPNHGKTVVATMGMFMVGFACWSWLCQLSFSPGGWLKVSVPHLDAFISGEKTRDARYLALIEYGLLLRSLM